MYSSVTFYAFCLVCVGVAHFDPLSGFIICVVSYYWCVLVVLFSLSEFPVGVCAPDCHVRFRYFDECFFYFSPVMLLFFDGVSFTRCVFVEYS